MTLVRKHVPILDHIHIKVNIVELVLAKSFSHEIEVAILNLYAAPNATFSNIAHVISNAFGHFHLNRPILLVGDFNIDMLQNTDRTKELEN
jgi:hypothetical protein